MYNVQFLDQLIDYLYGHKSYDYRAEKEKELLDPANSGKGLFWEKVVEKGMEGRAHLLETNHPGCDMNDKTDMKFATFTTWNSNNFAKVATIHIENKIGPLRICLVYPGRDKHKVYFMFVPTEAHINRKTSHPVKITWSAENERPTGEWWDKYRCSFAQVLQTNPEMSL